MHTLVYILIRQLSGIKQNRLMDIISKQKLIEIITSQEAPKDIPDGAAYGMLTRFQMKFTDATVTFTVNQGIALRVTELFTQTFGGLDCPDEDRFRLWSAMVQEAIKKVIQVTRTRLVKDWGMGNDLDQEASPESIMIEGMFIFAELAKYGQPLILKEEKES